MTTTRRAAMVLAAMLTLCCATGSPATARGLGLPVDLGTRAGSASGTITDLAEDGRAIGDTSENAMLWNSPGSYVSFPKNVLLTMLNDHGQAAGMRELNYAFKAILARSDGSVTDLLPGYSGDSDAFAINNSGEVAVRFGNGRLGLWRQGKLTEIPAPAGASAETEIRPVDINDAGQIAATIVDNHQHPPQVYPARCELRGCVRLPLPAGMGTPTDIELSAINNGATIAGTVISGQTSTAVVWTGDHADLLPAPPGQSSGVANGAHALNEHGEVVGWFGPAGQLRHAAMWSAGKLTALKTPADTNSTANAVNAGGLVVGDASDNAGRTHGFVWQQGRIDWLATLVPGTSTTTVAVNAAGQVGGNSIADTIPPSDSTVQRPLRWTIGSAPVTVR